MISVAMTTYNGKEYVEKQVHTLLSQTLLPDEIIICDDGSDDGTREILRNVAEENARIRVIENEENLGYRRNFKKAISLTQGDYIFLCDQDDEWHLDKIERMVKIMDEEKCAALCCDYALIDERSKPLKKEDYFVHPFIKKANTESLTRISFRRLIYGNILQGCTYCFTKEVKEAYLQLKNEDVDHDQQIMFVSALLGKTLFYKTPLIDYRIHSANAIGLSKKGTEEGIELKKPSRKPFMVTFLEELNQVIPVTKIKWYSILFYLRIPYFVSKLR